MRRFLIAGGLLVAVVFATGCRPADGAPSRQADAPAQVGSASPTAYQSSELGIALDLAPYRAIGDCRGDWQSEAPCLTVNGTVDAEAVTFFSLQAFDGPLEQVAREQAGFEPDPSGRWMTTFGRFEPVAVERVSGQGWTGMTATVTCGIGDAGGGFHAAGGECLWMVLSDGRRSIVAMTDGVHGLDPATAAMLASIRFVPG